VGSIVCGLTLDLLRFFFAVGGCAGGAWAGGECGVGGAGVIGGSSKDDTDEWTAEEGCISADIAAALENARARASNWEYCNVRRELLR
jgi:hypothetical protein